MKNLIFKVLILTGVVFTSCQNTREKELIEKTSEIVSEDTASSNVNKSDTADAAHTIKLALLLDTSNSMDGLIEQAKSQLWKIVNALSEAKKDDEYAFLEIALYEYGNDYLQSREGYVRQVLPFTSDLDTLSRELFALRTHGGEEYCGEVIRQSLEQLVWANDTTGLQVIIIAGNEPFDQGETSYFSSCENANQNGIFINTIFCGNYEEGIATNWKDGSKIARGYYGNIEMNNVTVYIDTPYDEEISALNQSLNETYIPIGMKGFSKVQEMQTQDANASYYGTSNTTERVIVKGKKNIYKNSSWDLVDASDEPDFDWSKIKISDLPINMQSMTQDEKIAYLESMKNKREKIQNEIKDLAVKRSEYIDAEKKKNTVSGESNFEDEIIKAVKAQAVQKGFVFES